MTREAAAAYLASLGPLPSFPDPERRRPQPSVDPDCPECRGVGVVRRDNYDFECGHCGRAATVASLQRVCGVDADVLARYTLDRYDVSLSPQWGPIFLAAAHRWVRQEGPPWLVILGDTGIGKTRIAIGAVAALVDRLAAEGGRQVARYATFSKWLGDVTDGRGQLDTEAVVADAGVHYLALDEIRSEWLQWEFQKGERALLLLLDERYIRRQPTLITSNLTLEEFPGPVQSRLLDASLAEVIIAEGAPDVRLRLVPEDIA